MHVPNLGNPTTAKPRPATPPQESSRKLGGNVGGAGNAGSTSSRPRGGAVGVGIHVRREGQGGTVPTGGGSYGGGSVQGGGTTVNQPTGGQQHDIDRGSAAKAYTAIFF